MGNNHSSSDETEDQTFLETSQRGDGASNDGDNLLNFSSLFQPDSLYKALLAIKEPPGSGISKNKDSMIKWLSGLADSDEHSVNIVQVLEHLTGKGVSNDEALEFFNEIDRDGEGQVDIAYLLMILKEKPVDLMQALVPCHLMPGPLEVYLPYKCSQNEAGRNLVQFLQTRRAECNSLVVGCMNQIISHQQTREKLVHGRYQMMLMRDEENKLIEGDTSKEDDGKEKVVVVNKCYSKIETSSSQHQIKNLTDNRSDSHWQSSGSPRNHWIRLHMLPGMSVCELTVTVDTNDESYMPKTIVISVGNIEKNLSEIKTINIPRHKCGAVLLVKNLGRVYRYVQINIRACHSDGCDARIRGLTIKASKLQEEKQQSVLDTMTIWYINLLASTAKAAIPVAPELKNILLTHSKSALNNLQPLVLSPSSPNRPEFLSTFVIEEMQKMLHTLSVLDQDDVHIESLEILLSFSISSGNVNSILDCLYMLLEKHMNNELNVLKLLQKMKDIKLTKYLSHSEMIQLSLITCTGGCKDEKHKPENIITSNTSAVPYVSSDGKKSVVLVFQHKDKMIISPTRLIVHVPLSDNAAQKCLIFCLKEEQPTQEWMKALSDNDSWDNDERKKWLHDESGLIAAMEFSKETPQVDIKPNVLISGRSLVMAICVTCETVTNVAVQTLSVYGYCNRPEEEERNKDITSLTKDLDVVRPLPLKGNVREDVVLLHTLAFVSTLLQDLSKLRKHRQLLDPSFITEPHLSVEGLSLEKIWKLYVSLSSNSDDQHPALLALLLLRSALPFITTKNQSINSSDILSHLCNILDAQDMAATTRQLAQDIVVEGVVIFFPDSTARKEYLLAMIDCVLNEQQPQSWWLKFEALCQYFSQTDANSLLGLPNTIKEGVIETTDTKKAMELLSTMLTVAMRESEMSLSSGKSRPDNLVSLLCALQASLFFWCRKNITSEVAQALLLKYVEKLVFCSTKILKRIADIDNNDKENKLKSLNKSLLDLTLAEMLVFLATITKTFLKNPRLMDVLYPLISSLHNATTYCPGIFPKLTETTSLEGTQDAVVGVWTRESSHNYENNAKVTEEFVCPSANKFVIDFDPRCITERRYDYLEFTDFTGAKQRFDGKYDTDRWPSTAEFPGQRLQFSFHSDGSNNEWGYLFTLKAYGQPAPSLHWLFDLQLSLARLMGQLTSATLSMKTLYTKLPEQKQDTLLTRSDVWKTLFRGGYMLRKLTRSLSGAHVAASPADSKLNSVLRDMTSGVEGIGTQLLNTLRSHGKGPYYGGELVDETINAVFAALIWHCQDLREELANDTHHEPSQLLQEAFTTAEALRRELVEARQKVLEAKGNDDISEMNEDTPLINCREKALFLLNFAGLSRVVDSEERVKVEDVDSGTQSNAISTVGRLKQQLSLGGLYKSSVKKPLSFGLVLKFVKNDAITKDKVHDLLQEREKLASCVAQGYTSAACYLSAITIDNMFELPGLVFLQQLISMQRHFPIHYAAKLDGCGLDLENEVRKAYYLLLQRLMEGLAAYSRPSTSLEYTRARVIVNIITCHLLDCQWLNYDHHLISDLQLPDFLLQSAIKSTQKEEKQKIEKFEGEDEMMTRYNIHMILLEKDKELGGKDVEGLQQLTEYEDNKWEGELYITSKKWSEDVNITVKCDSCQTHINNGVFYHNMDLKSTSYDLCPQCFKNGSGSRPDEHTPEQVYLAMGRFSCDHCKLYILTHRFHSIMPDDYDLCLGCFRKQESKESKKSWTVHLLTKTSLAGGSVNCCMTTDSETNQPLRYNDGYVTRIGLANDLMIYQQRHCWLLFISLCLSMANSLNNKHTNTSDRRYKTQACRNLLQCLRHLTKILHTAVTAKWEEEDKETKKKEETKDIVVDTETKDDGITNDVTDDAKDKDKEDTPSNGVSMVTESPPTDNEDLIIVTSRQRCHDNSKVTSMEKTFSSINLDTCLCTIAAVLPHDNISLSAWTDEIEDEVLKTVSECILPGLLEVALCPVISSITRQLALIIIAQYMARIKPMVADISILIARGQDTDDDGGLLTAKFFFSLGASFLQRSDFSGAATIAECMLILSKSNDWKDIVSQSVLSPLHTKPQEMDLSSIFGLMVLAGFPKLHRVGSPAMFCDQLSVITSVDGNIGTIINCESREPMTVKLSFCKVEDTLQGVITYSHLQSLLSHIHHCLQLAKQDDEKQVEATWILALTLKALLALMMGPKCNEVVSEFLKEGLLIDVSRLASKPTRFTQKWLASDLEVVAIRGYQPVSSVKRDETVIEEKDTSDKGKSADNNDKASKKNHDKNKKVNEEEACLEGLSDDIQDMLVIMQEAFQCPLTTLRALFDASGADVNQFIMSSEQYYDIESSTLKPPDEILEAAKKWELESDMVQHEVRDIQHSLEDIGVTRLIPVPYTISNIEAEPENNDIARKPKSSDLMQDVIKQDSDDRQEDITRDESFQLLQEQMKVGVVSRKELLNMQQAIVVLYSRRVLAACISHWPHPPHQHISTTLLGNMDITQFFCLLDLLMKPLNRQDCINLIQGVILRIEPTQLVSLAVKASEVMRRVCVGSEKKQFQYSSEHSVEEKGKVIIPNASSMSIVINQMAGEIELASNEDFCDHLKTLTSSSTQKELTHLIPGNAVYYRVKLETMKDVKQCTLTITGTQMGRFNTGLIFLEQLLNERENDSDDGKRNIIPFTQLWSNLIAVACHHTGWERLKVINLLLCLLSIMKESSFTERLNLSALKPLWQFYCTTLIKDHETKNKSQQVIAPRILRALTELFLSVENQAEEWGISQNMMIETLTKEGLGMWLEKGISNVAYLSIGLGLNNTASQAFIEAKQSYVPPVEDNTRQEEDKDSDSEPENTSSHSGSLESLGESSENSFES